ncbi:hypothetical protein HanRHA438_Chr02g0084461 [Helianthus annuus]|nr:hypothetical protein HanIR_Chr02g0085501 [Helianthus annuus]KAJ0619257.1 hypothetical protein HanHA89_Chr02g0069341 [Helianthus annuus]KAJ0940531.1 hypothetical protein HanRHA438_Chr02g0084461 [Helianthus annuus]
MYNATERKVRGVGRPSRPLKCYAPANMGTYTLILGGDWSYEMLVFGIKSKEKEERGCRDSDNVGESPGAFDSLCNELPEILFIQRCELLCPDGQGALTVRGTGRVYPTTEWLMHNCLMIDGFVKV